MAALRMRVTRDGRASGCRSADAALLSSSGKGTGETASRIPARSRLRAPAHRQPAPGRRGQEGASPAAPAAGGTATPSRAACRSRSWQGARPGTAVELLLLFALHFPFPSSQHASGLSILPQARRPDRRGLAGALTAPPRSELGGTRGFLLLAGLVEGRRGQRRGDKNLRKKKNQQPRRTHLNPSRHHQPSAEEPAASLAAALPRLRAPRQLPPAGLTVLSPSSAAGSPRLPLQPRRPAGPSAATPAQTGPRCSRPPGPGQARAGATLRVSVKFGQLLQQFASPGRTGAGAEARRWLCRSEPTRYGRRETIPYRHGD